MFLPLTQQTEAWRIARDVQREHEQWVKDNPNPPVVYDWSDRRRARAVAVNPRDIGVRF